MAELGILPDKRARMLLELRLRWRCYIGAAKRYRGEAQTFEAHGLVLDASCARVLADARLDDAANIWRAYLAMRGTE